MAKYDRLEPDEDKPGSPRNQMLRDMTQIGIANELAEANRLHRKMIEWMFPQMSGKELLVIKEDEA